MIDAMGLSTSQVSARLSSTLFMSLTFLAWSTNDGYLGRAIPVKPLALLLIAHFGRGR